MQPLNSQTKFVCLLENGIITEELLGYDQILPSFFDFKDAVKLFCHTFTITPLDHIDDTASNQAEKEYLMMCSKPAIPDHKYHHHLPQSPEIDPLVMKFSSGCVPLGCFGSTISCLLSKYRWEVLEQPHKSLKRV